MNNKHLLPIALCVALGLTLTGAPHAQERVAATPAIQYPSGTPTPIALQKKVDGMTKMVNILQSQLNSCREGKPGMNEQDIRTIVQDEILKTEKELQAKKALETPEAEEDETACQTTRSAPPSVRRGIRPAPMERLGCEDYSHSYFQRHPSMAAVCSVDISVEDPAAISATEPVSGTVRKHVALPSPTTSR